jgi:hypothetical protein
MRDGDRPTTDLHTLLERVEAASPVAAVDVVADELAAQVGALAIRFLIVDFSGRALVRSTAAAADWTSRTRPRAPNDALAAHAKRGEFVTGQLLRINLLGGSATIINAGHPWPLRLRHGHVDQGST